MLDGVKIMLGIEGSESDAVLTLMIQDATQAALDYCHIKTLPDGLQPIVRGMVVQQFNIQNEGNISSIKRGDTQTTYRDPIGVASFTDKQKSGLNAYRRLSTR